MFQRPYDVDALRLANSFLRVGAARVEMIIAADARTQSSSHSLFFLPLLFLFSAYVSSFNLLFNLLIRDKSQMREAIRAGRLRARGLFSMYIHGAARSRAQIRAYSLGSTIQSLITSFAVVIV